MSTKPKEFALTRMTLMLKGGEEPSFPPLLHNAHLVEWLAGLGYVQEGVAGVASIPHSELQAWAHNTGLVFEGMEAEWLHKMSAAYAGEIHRSSDENTSQPYDGGGEDT